MREAWDLKKFRDSLIKRGMSDEREMWDGKISGFLSGEPIRRVSDEKGMGLGKIWVFSHRREM
jgi:hypothetical protein